MSEKPVGELLRPYGTREFLKFHTEGDNHSAGMRYLLDGLGSAEYGCPYDARQGVQYSSRGPPLETPDGWTMRDLTVILFDSDGRMRGRVHKLDGDDVTDDVAALREVRHG